MKEFSGRKIRDEVLADLKEKIAALPTKPTLAVIWIGEDPVPEKYIRSKQKVADYVGVGFKLFQFSVLASEADVVKKIEELNDDQKVIGILVQMPLPAKINRKKVIKAISSEKDIDGLRFCVGLPSDFQPPVILAILEALDGINLGQKKVAIIGQGFLVGAPLAKILKNKVKELRVADINTVNISKVTWSADIIISATGQAGLIKADMVKKGAILIDAGTAESGGKVVGDIDPAACEKSSFYTPVPGGIGPLTVAALYKNLLTAALKNQK